ncbi:CheR family methyltransferase [Desulfoluna spongiiphila]|uniref:Chemotaxis protein methyltransferase CheR n=1 Tax=Desulfoluna spongiiphila TaxID=419481 RepID=A0A1G5CM59_9BACT|nr:CheR family methyltransferase [Desulfoluna spongiiphila]SCY03533.1 chemotaxis protein methyltransferase CheR [Desulfoluna spongiiphila]
MTPDGVERIEITLLLEAIYQRYGYDFRSFAPASISRRVRQFLSSSGLCSVSQMTERVLRDEGLFSRLVQYVSIPVTEMFRDPFVYRAVREQVAPLLRTWPHIKVWHAGCATGEEVYSLAIVLKETGILKRTTIYATDFNEANLARAREGTYDAARIKEADHRHRQAGGKRPLTEYCRTHRGHATMAPDLARHITFANHNLATDTSFGEVHLVFCRNVLIYFNRALQNRALNLFSESLVHGGFLCLGTRENLTFTEAHGAYVPVSDKTQIYKHSKLTGNVLRDSR